MLQPWWNLLMLLSALLRDAEACSKPLLWWFALEPATNCNRSMIYALSMTPSTTLAALPRTPPDVRFARIANCTRSIDYMFFVILCHKLRF